MMMLFILFLLCNVINSWSADFELQRYNPPQYLHEIANYKTIAATIESGAFLVPELCYAVSMDLAKNPLMILGSKPCIAAFIKAKNSVKTIAFHIHALNDCALLKKIIDKEK